MLPCPGTLRPGSIEQVRRRVHHPPARVTPGAAAGREMPAPFGDGHEPRAAFSWQRRPGECSCGSQGVRLEAHRLPGSGGARPWGCSVVACPTDMNPKPEICLRGGAHAAGSSGCSSWNTLRPCVTALSSCLVMLAWPHRPPRRCGSARRADRARRRRRPRTPASPPSEGTAIRRTRSRPRVLPFGSAAAPSHRRGDRARAGQAPL